MALWCCTTAEIAANSAVPPWLKGVGIDGEQRTDPIEWADRHRPGHDRGNVAVERRHAGGDGTPRGAVPQPSLEFCERHGGGRRRRRSRMATPAHAAACAMRAWAAF